MSVFEVKPVMIPTAWPVIFAVPCSGKERTDVAAEVPVPAVAVTVKYPAGVIAACAKAEFNDVLAPRSASPIRGRKGLVEAMVENSGL